MRIGLAGVGRIGAFHAETLKGLDAVDELVVTDADAEARPGGRRPGVGLGFAADPASLLGCGHRRLRHRRRDPRPRAPAARRASRPASRPSARSRSPATLDETIELAKLAASTDVPVHIGFQRRFDARLPRLRRGRPAAVSSASSTPSGRPPTTRRRRTRPTSRPAAASSATATCTTSTSSGSSPGREVVSVYATGANKGEPFFAEAGDVDTAAAVLTLDDGTLALVSSTRYNGARPRRPHGGRTAARAPSRSGLDDSLALRSAEDGRRLPARPAALVVHGAVPAGLPRRAHRLRRGRRAATGPQPVHRRRRARRRSASPRPASCRAARAASCASRGDRGRL